MDIIYHTGPNFFALYKKGDWLLKYGVFGVQNGQIFTQTTNINEDGIEDSHLWNYFQLLPLYLQLSKKLI